MRTGYTFAEVKDMLWVGSEDPADWRYKRRNTVLGHWRSLKLAMWEIHLGECEQQKEAEDCKKADFAEENGCLTFYTKGF